MESHHGPIPTACRLLDLPAELLQRCVPLLWIDGDQNGHYRGLVCRLLHDLPCEFERVREALDACTADSAGQGSVRASWEPVGAGRRRRPVRAVALGDVRRQQLPAQGVGAVRRQLASMRRARGLG